MAKQSRSNDVGPLWVARLVVILIVLIVGGAGVALYFVARGPR